MLTKLRGLVAAFIAALIVAVPRLWNALPESLRKVIRDVAIVVLILLATFDWVVPGSIAGAKQELVTFWTAFLAAVWAIVRTELVPLLRDWLLALARRLAV